MEAAKCQQDSGPLCPALDIPRTGEAELRLLSDLSSALPSPHPFLFSLEQNHNYICAVCLLCLGALIPCCLCSQKSRLVSFCAPVCFSSPLLFTHHFFYPVPVFTFLANIFLPKSLYSLSSACQPTLLWISHFSLYSCIKFSLKSPKVVTTSTIFLSNPYSAVLFPALVFILLLSSLPSHFSYHFHLLPFTFSLKFPLLSHKAFLVFHSIIPAAAPPLSPSFSTRIQEFVPSPGTGFAKDREKTHPCIPSSACLRLENGTEIRALIGHYSQNQLQLESPAQKEIVTLKESKSKCGIVNSMNCQVPHSLSHNSVSIRHNSPASKVIKILIKPRRCWDKSILRWHKGCAYISLI